MAAAGAGGLGAAIAPMEETVTWTFSHCTPQAAAAPNGASITEIQDAPIATANFKVIRTTHSNEQHKKHAAAIVDYIIRAIKPGFTASTTGALFTASYSHTRCRDLLHLEPRAN